MAAHLRTWTSRALSTTNDAPTSNPRRFQELRCVLRLHRHLHVSRTGTRGQEPVAGAFAEDRYPGRVPKGAACEVALLRAARAASPRTSLIISISSPPGSSAAALALPLSHADAHLVAVHAAAAAAAAAAAPSDDACGNVHARPRHRTWCVRRHGARHSLFRSPLPLARTRRRSLACSLSRAPRKSDVSPLDVMTPRVGTRARPRMLMSRASTGGARNIRATTRQSCRGVTSFMMSSCRVASAPRAATVLESDVSPPGALMSRSCTRAITHAVTCARIRCDCALRARRHRGVAPSSCDLPHVRGRGGCERAGERARARAGEGGGRSKRRRAR